MRGVCEFRAIEDETGKKHNQLSTCKTNFEWSFQTQNFTEGHIKYQVCQLAVMLIYQDKWCKQHIQSGLKSSSFCVTLNWLIGCTMVVTSTLFPFDNLSVG